MKPPPGNARAERPRNREAGPYLESPPAWRVQCSATLWHTSVVIAMSPPRGRDPAHGERCWLCGYPRGAPRSRPARGPARRGIPYPPTSRPHASASCLWPWAPRPPPRHRSPGPRWPPGGGGIVLDDPRGAEDRDEGQGESFLTGPAASRKSGSTMTSRQRRASAASPSGSAGRASST